METRIENEIKKVTANGNATVGNSFEGMQTRSSELVQFKTGDVITFPTDLTGAVVTVPVRGAKDENGDQIYAKYVPVTVDRKVEGRDVQKVIPFYPSSFWKSRQECDKDGNNTGVWHRASGAVADMVADDYNTVDEAIPAIGKHGKVKVTVDTFKTLPFGAVEGTRPVNTSIMKFEWA